MGRRSDALIGFARWRRAKRWLIEPYLGFGTQSKLTLPGRVLEDRRLIPSTETDTSWRNLRNTYKRFATREVAGARVCATFKGAESIAITDSEGYFCIQIELDAPPDARLWQELELQLIEPRAAAGTPTRATAEVLVPPPGARFGVVSDIDDTVVATHVASTFKMLLTVLFSNAHVRTPFKGIAAFYRALHGGASGAEANPIFYVSNGPWNLYGLLIEFFKLNEIPLGPLFLRDFGPQILFPSRPHMGHKLSHIGRILEAYPHLPFILIGDSGERDPEIYAEIATRYPDRIRAIYIRSVDQRQERLAAIDALAATITAMKTQFVLAPDSEFAAVHAAAEGLIASHTLALIREEKKGAG
ncbi:MAG TPA: phosphatase domain-containing protein [Burkholderiales bacterium]|nr:phosphatase domain-containing protein [Burkholderiales bacterium]